MNGQFRYYLANVVMVKPQGECKTPLLAVNLAVENLHGTPTVAIYGEFTFTPKAGDTAASDSFQYQVTDGMDTVTRTVTS